jgi:hypothetical protein
MIFLALLACCAAAHASQTHPSEKLDDVPVGFTAKPNEYLVQFEEDYTLDEHLAYLGLDGNASYATFEPLLLDNGYWGQLCLPLQES